MPGFDAGKFTQEGQDRAESQKRALMGVIAEHGQAGAQAYADSQAQVAAQGQQAQAGAANRMTGSAVEGNSSFANENNSRMAAITNLYTQDLNHGKEALGNDMARMSASNSNYQDQIGQAMPMVAQNIAGQFQAAQQRIAEEDAKREKERQMQELALEAARVSLEGDKVRAAAAGANGGDNRTDAQKKHDDLVNQGLEQEIANGGVSPDKRAELVAAEREKGAMRHASDVLGGVGTNGWAAFQAILDGKISVQDAQKQFHTPRGKSLSWGVIQDLVKEVNNARLS